MIDKLLTLTSRHSGPSSLMGIREKTLTNPRIHTIQVLDGAISKQRQVAFLYNNMVWT